MTTIKIHMSLKKYFEDVRPDILPKLNRANRNPIKHMLSCAKMVKRLKPKLIVVDVSSGIRNLLAVRWMKKNRRRVMVVIQGQRMAFRYNNIIVKHLVRYSEEYVISKADLILVNSEFMAKTAKRLCSNEARIIVARPGVEFTSRTDAKISDNEGELKLLFVGECTEVKGLLYLVEAMILIKNLNPVLNVAGKYDITDNYYKKIYKIIDREKLQGRVKFLNHVNQDKLQDLYRSSTIYVMPSLSEGYGISLAEAISFGLPVVASRAGAIPEMVEAGVNAILVEPGDPVSLADGIRRLAHDGELRRKMSRVNFQKAGTLPTWESFSSVLADKLIPLIRELLNE